MSHSRFFATALGACTLWASAACSATGARDDAPPPPVSFAVSAVLPSSTTQPADRPALAEPGAGLPVVGARDTEPSAPARSARPSSMQVLNQVLTTQALLVSLLLTPLSKDAAEQPLARADTP